MADRRTPGWFSALVEDAADLYGVSPDAILSTDRHAIVVEARSVIMWSLRQARLSLPHIGHLMGRDHSTVLTALRRVEGDPGQLNEARRLRDRNVPRELWKPRWAA